MHDAFSHEDASRRKVRKYELLVQYARQFVNAPYASGGTSPKGFDCSGFTNFVYQEFGITLPRTAKDQSKEGKRVGKRRARKGDLIFFRGSNARKRRIGHVGIVVSDRRDQPIQFIHASSRGVVISSLDEPYYAKRYRKVRCFPALKRKVRIDE